MDTEDVVSRLVKSGKAAEAEGNYFAAIRFFEDALDHGAEGIGLNLGSCYLDLGRVDDAARAYERAWKSDDDLDAAFLLAQIHQDKGEIAQARGIYALLLDSGRPEGLYEEAYFLRYDGRLLEAEQMMERAAAISGAGSNGDLAAGALGMWRWSERNDPSAESLLRRGANVSPNSRDTLANLLLATGREGEAAQVWQEGAQAGELESMISLANHLEDVGDIERAEMILREAVALDDGHAAYNLYKLLKKTGRGSEGEGFLRLAFDHNDELAVRRLARRAGKVAKREAGTRRQ